jgi:hypothetical protein
MPPWNGVAGCPRTLGQVAELLLDLRHVTIARRPWRRAGRGEGRRVFSMRTFPAPGDDSGASFRLVATPPAPEISSRIVSLLINEFATREIGRQHRGSFRLALIATCVPLSEDT